MYTLILPNSNSKLASKHAGAQKNNKSVFAQLRAALPAFSERRLLKKEQSAADLSAQA